MRAIEDIVQVFESLSPSDGYRWPVETLVPRRLYICRGLNEEFTIIVEGDRDSFGGIPPLTGIEYSASVIAIPENRTFSALRVCSSDAVHGNRVMAHIAYELARRLEENPSIDNTSLLAQVEWILPLLGAAQPLLTPERQRGLVGECISLRSLLLLARRLGLGPTAVLERWWGHSSGRRDFAAAGVAIEVKTTGLNTRVHHVGTIEQLDPDSAEEQVYVLSIGIKTDPTGAKKLPHFVADVEEQLTDSKGRKDADALQRFATQLSDYGYDRRHENSYLSAPGFLRPHLLPALFRETDLDRLRLSSFVDGVLPRMVAAVSYTLDIKCDAVTEDEANSVYKTLLTQPVLAYQSSASK